MMLRAVVAINPEKNHVFHADAKAKRHTALNPSSQYFMLWQDVVLSYSFIVSRLNYSKPCVTLNKYT